MTWLVWRQHRKQALFALLGLAALAAFLVPTGLQMHSEFNKAGLDDCLPAAARVEFVPVNPSDPPGPVRACQERAEAFAGRFGSRGSLGILFWFLPLLAGLFWGAPLVAREVEHGTHRLVWTQGVSRLRWAVVKFGLVGAGVLLAAACYALLVTWWRAPLDQTAGGTAVGNRFGYLLFDLEGLVPVGYALFAVALGVFAGSLTRRTQAAMAVTLVGFMATRLLVEFLARPRFLAPVRRTYPVIGSEMVNPISGDWIIRAGVYSAEGTRLAGGTFGNYSNTVCPPASTLANAPPTTDPCVVEYGAGAYNLELLHPSERYWLIQGIETALFVVLAVLLLLAAVHWVRRRIT
jgi:hypothetical protein